MDILNTTPRNRGFLNGQFLIAMPSMGDDRFARTVVYICAHSSEGAMGFIINQVQSLRFSDLLVQLGVIGEEEAISLPEAMRHIHVRNGGPVDQSRGFVLHSDDYMVDSTMPVADDICLTATVDILRAIAGNGGPSQALMALGYSGWAPGQLEAEIAGNGWLTCPASRDLLFDGDISTKYERLLAHLGIDLSRLVNDVGHA
ncbi:YqgE/AlgH family protein [Brucella sp. IR073]|uniref:YqgE/AlgH family protein n=1 Tax=unclassified Brucella TaxID=2632610 RepID=UPI003B97D3FF